jgi:hypothetical protein
MQAAVRQRSRQTHTQRSWRRTHAALLHCWARSVDRTSASCPCSLCSPLSPQGSATSSCDDTPWMNCQNGVRRWLPVKKNRQCADETATDIISKKLFLSPAKTIFKHKVESGVTPVAAWSKRE